MAQPPTPWGDLGERPDDAPSFDPPTAQPAGTPPPPTAQPAWTPPPPPPATRPRRTVLVAAITIGALMLGAIGWFALSLLTVAPTPVPAGSVPASSGAASKVPASTASMAGPDIGREVSFESGGGSATVVMETATWTNRGDMDPRPGLAYLIVDLTFTGTGGEVPVGALFVQAEDSEGRSHLMTYGPSVDEPLASSLLTEGGQHRGQVGFELPPGPVTVRILDAALRPVATLAVPQR